MQPLKCLPLKPLEVLERKGEGEREGGRGEGVREGGRGSEGGRERE